MPKVIERVYGEPRPRVARFLVEDHEVGMCLASLGRWESQRAVNPETLPADIRGAVEAPSRSGEGHVEWLGRR
jgi:hypothetical protein